MVHHAASPPPQKNRMVANNYNTITLNKIYHCSTGVSQTLVNSLTHLKGKVSFKFFGKIDRVGPGSRGDPGQKRNESWCSLWR